MRAIQPGEGWSGDVGSGVSVISKVEGADISGALSISEVPFAVGALVPPHVHSLEDECSIVLEGEVGFRSDDTEVVLGSGGYIVKPRGGLHAMWNAGQVPARIIEIITPAGFERFFREVAELLAVGHLDAQTGARIGERYGLRFAEPAWLDDVIERYHLVRPGPG